MVFVLVAPPPVEPWTGGHLYDRWVVERSGGAVVERRVGADSLGRTLEELSASGAGAIVVDGLFLADAEPGTVARAAARTPVVWLVHYLADRDPSGGRPGRSRATIDAALRAAAGAVATSDHTARDLARRLPGRPLAVCRPGVERLGGGGRAGRAGAAQRGAPRLVTLASMEPRKNQLEVLECLAALRELAWRWDLAGGAAAPDYAREFERAVRAHGLGQRVAWHGARSPADARALLRAGDALVLASRYEPYGMVCAEAVVEGVPVVGYATGGVVESVEHGRTGLLAPPGDAVALRGLLRDVIADASLRRAMRTACLEAAARFPDWGDVARRFVAAVERIAAAARRKG